ncbi:MAG TPA: class II aldolase/adducin family protein [Thermoanaerobaculaceae bacterium]|nr:class II aldolase/adducin family protein [Thermoanaerobaculaceae bacterium]HPS78679.1 class II aldolase/adducin family protein [Thermoanaerobaculaceae bacterium]
MERAETGETSLQEPRLRAEIVAVGASLTRLGLIRGAEGNISVRVGATGLLVTPSGWAKGRLRGGSLVMCHVDAVPTPEASSEILVHLLTYQRHPHIAALVHAHPPGVLALATRGAIPDPQLLREGRLLVPRVARVPALEPGTRELAEECAMALGRAPAVVMARHGAITSGSSLREALQRMEVLELLAQTALSAHGGRV